VQLMKMKKMMILRLFMISKIVKEGRIAFAGLGKHLFILRAFLGARAAALREMKASLQISRNMGVFIVSFSTYYIVIIDIMN